MALLEVYNENGMLQFTEDQYPFNLKQIITVDCSSFGSPITQGGNTNSRPVVYYTGSVNIGTSQAIIASRGDRYHTPGIIDGNGNLELKVERGSGMVYIYVFVKGSVSQNTSSGFTVWGPDGNISFTADDKPLKPVKTLVYCNRDANGYRTDTPLSFDIGGGRTAAYVHTAQAYLNSGENESNTVGYRNLRKGWGYASGSLVQMNFIRTVRLRLGAQDDLGAYVNDIGIATIIDVTNY